MPSDPQVLIAQAKCYECFGPITVGQALRLSTLANALHKLNAVAATDPQSLMAYGKCFACFGLSAAEIMEISLLDQIANAAGGGGGGGGENLSQTLTIGNDAGNQNAVNFSGLRVGTAAAPSTAARAIIAGTGGAGQAGFELFDSSIPSRWLFYVGAGGTDTLSFFNVAGGFDALTAKFDTPNLFIGVNNPAPIFTLDVSGSGNFTGGVQIGGTLGALGDINCTGKGNFGGGVDPPYVLLDRETRASVKERVLREVKPEKQGGSALFHNKDTGRIEIYVAETDLYYSIDGQLLT